VAVWDYLRSLFGSSGRRSRTGAFPAVGGREAAPQQRERRRSVSLLGLLYGVLLAAACSLVLDYGVLPPPFKLHDRAPGDIHARVEFDFESPERQREAAREALPVFRPVSNWEDSVLKDLRLYCTVVAEAGSIEQAQGEASVLMRPDVPLVEALFRYHDQDRQRSLFTLLLGPLEGALKGLARNGVLDANALKQRVWDKPGRKAILRVEPSNAYREIEPRDLRGIENAISDIDFKILRLRQIPDDLRKELLRYFQDHLNPSLEFDERETLAESRRQLSNPENAFVRYPAGAVLVTADSSINDEALRLLVAESTTWKAKRSWRDRLAEVGGSFVISLTMVLFCLVAFWRLRIGPMRTRPLIMLGLVALAALAVARLLLVNGLPLWLAPVAFVAMVASLAFSPVASLPVTLAVAVLCGFAAQRSVTPVVALLMGGVVSAIPARLLQNRGDLIRFGLLGGMAQALTTLGILMLEPLRSMGGGTLGNPQLLDVVYGFANPVGCSLLLLGSLPLIEWAFGIVTNIRLMELSDQNHPALRRIMIEAPGTWAHTLQVASLCEPAAEAIGGDPRLIRAGVYFHDLGKTLKPEYFVENQLGAEELHKRLSPTVSALIILSHVKDGTELAREYGLPPQIVSFIPEHHGTTLIKFFYHQARAKAKEDKREDDVQESFFRYPGPKPQSRETAIVMLADTAEAASRTLESPSATRLRTFIHEMIMQKLLDGQLDECDLTFRELAIVEETFIRVLISRFHNRIRYPGQEPEPTKAMPAVSDSQVAKTGSSAARSAVGDSERKA
jgi:hypothetical protein